MANTAALPINTQLVEQHLNKHVLEGRRKFNLAVEDELLDYKHNHPMHIENCATTLLKIFGNVLDSPDEEKFRKVKATSNALKNNVLSIKGGEHLLTLAGWVPQVVDLERYYVFDGDASSTKWGIMTEGRAILEKGLALIHEKAEKKQREKDEKLKKDFAQKEKIRIALEDDKLERRIRNQMTAVQGPVAATALPARAQPSYAPPRAQPGAVGQGADPEDDADEEED